jgi:hypothetical protein
MTARFSKISLTVFFVLLVLSFFVLSVPGDCWPWYLVMAPFGAIPAIIGPKKYRLYGAIAVVLSVILIFGDIESGKHFRARHPEIYRR